MRPKSIFIITLLALPVFAVADPHFEMPTVVVIGKADDMLGEAASASEGTASAVELLAQPYLRRSEILEIVPGLVTTQHAGGGKATQYFLRGFNLDHGTEFAISIDGMPINMRTHAHGQGYADLNFLIPEFIGGVAYTKGVYAARNGDLSSAGSADFRIVDRLAQGFVTATVGEEGYYRTVLGHSFEAGPGTLTLGGEINTYDGPWENSENFLRWNGIARWFLGDDDNHTAITAMSGATDWDSSDQIPRRAVQNGTIGRFGTVDNTTGGDSQRHSLQFLNQSTDADTVTRVSAYGVYYDMDLYSNFTYFLDDPVNGDQFQQTESRIILGGDIQRTWLEREAFGKPAEFTVGFQTRNDMIDDIGLHNTSRRNRVGTVREDDVFEGSYSIFGESTVRWTDTFRTITGLRADLFYFDVDSGLPANSGSEWDAIVSPKLGMVFGPFETTEYYLNFGTGFHSNDARGVLTTVDPSSGEAVPKVDPLVRTIGAEIGVRTRLFDQLTSTFTVWWLDSDSELVYVGDAGTNEAGPASRRFGIEWASYWRPNDWLTADTEISLSYARFRNAGPEDRVPNSIPVLISGGVSLGREEGWFGGFRVRAFSSRPLEETGNIEGKSTFTLNGRLGYRRDNWEIALDVLNILDRNDNDIEYFYESRLANEASGREDIHFHPAEPRMLRVSATYRF